MKKCLDINLRKWNAKAGSHAESTLEQLPDAHREALVLQHWHGWTLRQIAEHMGRSTEAVAGLLKRGLKQLKRELRESE